jgi:Glycosyl transferase family 2
MPAYNAAQTIDSAVLSVVKQSFTQWELIVVDDGSTDDSRERVQSIAAQDSRIKLVAVPHIGQLANIRNIGVHHARAAILGFLDSDDCYEPDTLQQLYDYLATHPQCNLVYGQYVMTDINDQLIVQQPGNITVKNGQPVVNSLPEHTWPNILTSRVSNQMQGLLLRKTLYDATGGFPEVENLWCPDFVFFVRACLDQLESIHALPMVAFRYRQMPGSMTYNPAKQILRVQSVQKEMTAIYTHPASGQILPLRSSATAAQYFHKLRPLCRLNQISNFQALLEPVFADSAVTPQHKAKLVIKCVLLMVKNLCR